MLSETFRVFLSRLQYYALLTVVLSLPELASDYFLPRQLRSMMVGSAVDPAHLGRYFATLSVAVALTIATASFGQAVLISRAWHDLRRQPIGIGAILGRGLARWPIILCLLVVVYALVLIGALFLLFPGIVIAVMAFVAGPACVIERAGPFRSLTRSIDLTEGHRWRVFAIFLLILVVPIGTSLLAQHFLEASFPTAYIAMQFTMQVVTASLGAIVGAATYLDLRIAKEGGDIERLASVFD